MGIVHVSLDPPLGSNWITKDHTFKDLTAENSSTSSHELFAWKIWRINFLRWDMYENNVHIVLKAFLSLSSFSCQKFSFLSPFSWLSFGWPPKLQTLKNDLSPNCSVKFYLFFSFRQPFLTLWFPFQGSIEIF